MLNWKMWLQMLFPMLISIGQQKIDEDDNDTGTDDIIGQSILFGVKLFKAILGGDTASLKDMIPAKHLVAKPTSAHFDELRD